MAAVVALLVVVLAVRQLTRANTVEIWTAKTPLKVGQKVDASSLKLARVARTAVPAGAITDMSRVVGRVLAAPVAAGAPLTMQEFQPAGKQIWLSDAPEPGRSVMAVRLGGAVVPAQQFRENDRLDVYAVGRDAVPQVVARDARYLGSLKNSPLPRSSNALADLVGSASKRSSGTPGTVALVLSVRQQDVETVASAQGSGRRLVFALHGINEPPYVPVAARPEMAPPTVDLILGSNREKVTVLR